MTTLTEQQIDAEVSRYEPDKLTDRFGTTYYWDAPNLPAEVFLALDSGEYYEADEGDGYATHRAYHTREAAFADLRQAIRASGVQHPQEEQA